MHKPLAQTVISMAMILGLASAGHCGTKAVVLSQWEEIAGEHEVTATLEALRMDSKKSQTVLIAKAPTWKVYFFNDRKKVLYECDAAQWRCPFGLAMGVVAAVRFKPGPGVDKGAAVVAGLPARCLAEVYESEKSRLGKLVGMVESKADYYVSDSNLKYPKELCRILQRSFGMPPADGLPLKMEVFADRGCDKQLRTTSCRFANVDKKVFDVPTSYRKVRSDSEVVLMSDTEDLINDFTGEEPADLRHKH